MIYTSLKVTFLARNFGFRMVTIVLMCILTPDIRLHDRDWFVESSPGKEVIPARIFHSSYSVILVKRDALSFTFFVTSTALWQAKKKFTSVSSFETMNTTYVA